MTYLKSAEARGVPARRGSDPDVRLLPVLVGVERRDGVGDRLPIRGDLRVGDGLEREQRVDAHAPRVVGGPGNRRGEDEGQSDPGASTE